MERTHILVCRNYIKFLSDSTFDFLNNLKLSYNQNFHNYCIIFGLVSSIEKKINHNPKSSGGNNVDGLL